MFNIFKQDPLKKLMKEELPKDKIKALEHAFFSHGTDSILLSEIFFPTDPPEVWASAAKVYGAALKHESGRVQMLGVFALDELSEKRLDLIKPLGDAVILPLRGFLNTTANLEWRLSSAVSLARIDGKNSSDVIRPFLDSIKNQKIQAASLPYLIEAYDLLGLPEGKELAYKAFEVYNQFNSIMGIASAQKAFVSAVRILANHRDDESIDHLGKLVNAFAVRIQRLTQYSSAQLDAPKGGLEITLKALAALTDRRAIEILINHIKWAASLSSRGRQLSPNSVESLTNIYVIRSTARQVIKIWEKSANSQALSLLNESLDADQVKLFLESKE